MDRTNTDRLRVLVVDDEKLARDFLVRMLARFESIQTCMATSSLAEAKANLHQHHPDILFLDIEMPGGSGFELLDGSTPEESPITIITTAYPQFGPKAFDVQACDYLLKPFDQERLSLALDRAEEAMKSRRRTARSERKITLPVGPRTVRLAAHEIDWIEAEGNYVHIHTPKERLFCRSSLGKLQRHLQSRMLLRVHRSYVVNIHRIKEIKRSENRHYSLILRDGTTVKCSRRCRRRLHAALQTVGGRGR